MELEGSKFMVQVLPTLWKYLVVQEYGSSCYKGRLNGCTWLQISKRISELVWKYWGKCQEFDCTRPGMHACRSGKLICCYHVFRLDYYHQKNPCTCMRPCLQYELKDEDGDIFHRFDISLFKNPVYYVGLNIKAEILNKLNPEEYASILYKYSDRFDFRIRLKKAFMGVKEKYQMLIEEWMSGKRLDYVTFNQTLEKGLIAGASDEFENEPLRKRQK